MLASAVSTYIRRYAVLPGQNAVVFTNNDAAYDAALALQDAGASVVVIDARSTVDGTFAQRARDRGIRIRTGQVIVEAKGGKRIDKVVVYGMDEQDRLKGEAQVLSCDLLALSGGFSPVIHLQCQAGSKPAWDDRLAAFVPGKPAQSESSAGACRGQESLLLCAEDGWAAGAAAARATGFKTPDDARLRMAETRLGALRPLWLVPHPKGATRGP